MKRLRWQGFCTIVMPWLLCGTTAHADYALRDGDTVVFLGDSITAARTYGKIVENYTLLRFPERKVRFFNAGLGGDTASGGAKRLEKDVFPREATVVIVAFGFNDIGWGVLADEEHRQKYLDGIRSIIQQCQQRHIRVFICSGAVTAADPEKSEQGFFQKMCDDGMALARSMGEEAIDVQRTMREIQRRVLAINAAQKGDKGKVSLHAADGAHLTDLGQLAMAYAILKGLNAPADISAATINAADAQVVAAEGCRVTGLKQSDEGLEFDRLDEGRPINFGLFGALQFLYVPVHDQLNRYMLTVTHLPAGRHEVVADGRVVGTFPHNVLATGINISSHTPNAWQPGGPWDAEATILSRLTEARSELGLASYFLREYRPGHPQRAELDEQFRRLNESLEQAQRTLVQPTAYHYVIRPAMAK